VKAFLLSTHYSPVEREKGMLRVIGKGDVEVDGRMGDQKRK
jgi:hypothetical protein